MSRVEFNLLPDVKLDYDRAQRTKILIFNLSFLISVIAIALVVIAFFMVDIVQKKSLSDADKDITAASQELQGIKDLDKILTIQNQLGSLPGLHQQKHITSRLFDYLPQITPPKINIGKLTLDTGTQTITLTGTSDKIESINKFIDTLKFTQFSLSDSSDKTKAFTDVILTSSARDEKSASYTIDFSYDPALFDPQKTITLIVPQETTTRSVINSPGSNTTLFDGQTKIESQQNSLDGEGEQ